MSDSNLSALPTKELLKNSEGASFALDSLERVYLDAVEARFWHMIQEYLLPEGLTQAAGCHAFYANTLTRILTDLEVAYKHILVQEIGHYQHEGEEE